MKRLVIPAIGFGVLLAIAPCALGQSPVYTNADLGHHIKSSVRVSPEEAAAIMAAHLPVIDGTPAPADGPRVYIMDSRPGDGPYGPLWPFEPARRLDGTPLSQPPDLYGEPLWWFGGDSFASGGRQRPSARGGIRDRGGRERGSHERDGRERGRGERESRERGRRR